eukprot:162383_1
MATEQDLAEHLHINTENNETNETDDAEADENEAEDSMNSINEIQLTTDQKQIELPQIANSPSKSHSKNKKSSPNNTKQRNLGSMIKIAANFDKELNSEIKNSIYEEEGIIPIVLLNIELDRRRAKIKLFVKLIVYCVFFIVYLTGLLNQRQAYEGYLLTTSIQRELVHQQIINKNGNAISFEDISVIEDLWDWMEHVYVIRLFDPFWYSNKNDTYSQNLWHSLGYQTKAIGGFRLTQTRSEPNEGPLCYESVFNYFVDDCFSNQKDSTANIMCGDRLNCNFVDTHDAFKYRSDGFGFSGYYIDFAFNESIDSQNYVIQQMEELKHNRWIDERTRYVQIMTNFYNNNYKRWARAEFTVHIDLAGKVEEYEDMHILRIELYSMENVTDVFGLLLEITFIIFVFGFAVFQIKLCYTRSKTGGVDGFIRNAKKHWFDWICVISNIIVIILWLTYYFNSHRRRLVNDGFNNKIFSSYISLQQLVNLDRIYIEFNVINLMVITVNGIQYFQVTDSGEAVYVALTDALPMIISFLPMYFMSICGFAIAGNLLFGYTETDFSTFWDAIYVVVEMNFGSYSNTQNLWNNSRILGRIYILALFFIFIPFLINIFLAIIINAWDGFFELRNALSSVQQFGIRKIAFTQTVKAWWNRLPLKNVRDAMDNIESDEIGYDEFVTLLDSLENVSKKHEETILDYFWPHRDKNDEDDIVTLENHAEIGDNRNMLTQLFSIKDKKSVKHLNIEVAQTLRSQTKKNINTEKKK